MKIITLNMWGGRVHAPLMSFLERNSEVDVFCFQEVYSKAPEPVVEDKGDRLDLLSEIKNKLPNHRAFFTPDMGDYFGIAMCTKNSSEVVRQGAIQVYDSASVEKGNHSRNLQFTEISLDGMGMTIANVHGLWNGQGKTDTDDRLLQSDRIIQFLEKVAGPVVVCGDFNLLPDTESLKKLERFGLRNLVTEHGVTSTRSSLYTKSVKFADYILVKHEVQVKDFAVLPDEVSDHLPLLLEI